jgi:hypothetical protein
MPDSATEPRRAAADPLLAGARAAVVDSVVTVRVVELFSESLR